MVCKFRCFAAAKLVKKTENSACCIFLFRMNHVLNSLFIGQMNRFAYLCREKGRALHYYIMYWELFKIFFRIGAFTIGGGYAMVPLIEDEIVSKRAWIKSEDFLDLLAIAQSSPGILAVNIAIFVGYRLKGVKGSLVTSLGAVLPSFLMILAIALFFQQFKDNIYVEKIFKGIRPAVVALIAAPTFKLGKSAQINRYNIWIPIASALLIWLLGFSPIWIIIAAGLGGFVYGKFIIHNS